jgi:hypothetical protein
MKPLLFSIMALVFLATTIPAFADTNSTQMSVTATISSNQVHQEVINAEMGSLANRIFSVEPYEILGLETYMVDSTGKISTYWDMTEHPTGEYLFNTYDSSQGYAETTIFWNNTTTEIPTPEPEIKPNTIMIPNNSATTECVDSPLGCFTPRILTVNEGEKINFLNLDSSMHTFKSVNNTLFDSGFVLAGGDPFYWIATESTDYECEVHPWAKGHIEVIPKPEVIPTVVTIQTDKTQYSHGDTMTFSGVASPVQEPDNRPDFVKDHSVNKVMIEIYQDEKTRSSKYLAIDEQGNYLFTTPEIEPTRHDMGTYTIKVTYLDQTAETDFDIIEWTPTYKTTPIPEPTPQPEHTPSGTDWQGKYLEVLSDFNEVSARAGELQSENNDLQQQIGDLEKTVDDLNAVIMEQLKVIYDWVLGK